MNITLIPIAIIIGLSLSLYFFRNEIPFPILLIGMVLLIGLMYRTTLHLEAFLSGRGLSKTTSLTKSSTCNFVNFNLTEKPRDSNAPNPTYMWWKYWFNPQQNQKYQICDQYRCQTNGFNGYQAHGAYNLVSGKYIDPVHNLQSVSHLGFEDKSEYYENPSKFCHQYPDSHLCPNHWIHPEHSLVRLKSKIQIIDI